VKLEVLHIPECPSIAVLTRRLDELIGRRADVVVEFRVIRDEDEALTHRMTGSPTLLVDGLDAFPMSDQPPSLSCRLYRDEAGAVVSAPSLAQLRRALALRRRTS
jgi:hypothetical protein